MQCIVQLIVMVQSDNFITTTTIHIHITNTKSELMVVISV